MSSSTCGLRTSTSKTCTGSPERREIPEHTAQDKHNTNTTLARVLDPAAGCAADGPARRARPLLPRNWTPQEAVLKVLQRARARCDEKKLLLALAGIYERTVHRDDAEKTLSGACRKFAQSCKVWLRKVAFDLSAAAAGDKAAAPPSATVDRAVKALPARKHVKFLTQAALLEFRSGSPERARTVFEGVLQAHPRRLDLWSVYIDQEVKLGDQQRVRALMERAVHTDQPAKKMKFLFKRYLQYEAEHGDDAAVAHVRRLAQEFVESKGGGAL